PCQLAPSALPSGCCGMCLHSFHYSRVPLLIPARVPPRISLCGAFLGRIWLSFLTRTHTVFTGLFFHSVMPSPLTGFAGCHFLVGIRRPVGILVGPIARTFTNSTTFTIQT